MPHLLIEYSANIEQKLGLDELLDRLHATAIDTGLFPLGGIRIRAYRAEHYRVADCDDANAFVHVTALVGSGRPLDKRQRASEQLFETLCAALEPLVAASPLAISFTMQEFHPLLNFKKNNLHEYVRRRQAND
ncbi:MAG: 5-carboxymethyl-2-hydroxymuconate Delta-isomerase [Gammaproteobacteria bacterium]|nr:5-carboxymethyl-2-hydroxymuconate Delta-isomerase [Gammaproteobacteria bacterium]